MTKTRPPLQRPALGTKSGHTIYVWAGVGDVCLYIPEALECKLQLSPAQAKALRDKINVALLEIEPL